MKKVNILLKPAIVFLVLISCSLYAAETTKYTGTVYARPVKHLMPLGNGDAVLIIEVAGVVALSGNPPSMATLSCSGMGLQKTDSSTSADFYCNMKENEEDSFDFKGKSSETADGKSQGTFDVVGGSGKWKDATGKGKFVRIEKSGDANKTSFVMDITTP